MLFKVVIFMVLLFLVYILFFKKTREDIIGKKGKKDEILDTMEQCPTCDIFISKNEAILSNGRYFCSKKCLDN